MEKLIVWTKPGENCSWWLNGEILKTLDSGFIGKKWRETLKNIDSWEKVERYTEFHDDYIGTDGGTAQQRIDGFWDRALRALEAGDMDAYNGCMNQIKNLEEVHILDALMK